MDKNYAPVENLQLQQQQQNRISDPFPIIVRQMRTSGKQKASGSQTPPYYSKQTLWIAAILLGGGGAYIIYENLKGNDESGYSKKRKFNINIMFVLKKQSNFNSLVQRSKILYEISLV